MNGHTRGNSTIEPDFAIYLHITPQGRHFDAQTKPPLALPRLLYILCSWLPLALSWYYI